jgi:hypothetical protein
MTGVVYFIQEGPSGAIKIGWSRHPVSIRLRQLQTGNSAELILLGFVCDCDKSEEIVWRRRFWEFRKRNEWFYPADALLKAIEPHRVPPPKRYVTVQVPFEVSA